MNDFDSIIRRMAVTQPEPGDYTGEDGLLYCGKCHTAKQFRLDVPSLEGRLLPRPRPCHCRQGQLDREAAEQEAHRHRQIVANLKRRGFTDPAMQEWSFANDNGRCQQMKHARFYVEHWEIVRRENIGYLLWGGVGTGKSYFAGCIANALMEQEIAVRMTNFALILNDLTASFEGRNEYIARLCRAPLLYLFVYCGSGFEICRLLAFQQKFISRPNSQLLHIPTLQSAHISTCCSRNFSKHSDSQASFKVCCFKSTE